MPRGCETAFSITQFKHPNLFPLNISQSKYRLFFLLWRVCIVANGVDSSKHKLSISSWSVSCLQVKGRRFYLISELSNYLMPIDNTTDGMYMSPISCQKFTVILLWREIDAMKLNLVCFTLNRRDECFRVNGVRL